MTAPVEAGRITYESQPPPEYSYEEYLAAVGAIVAELAAIIAAVGAPFQGMDMTRRDWIAFLAAIYPYVEQARRAIAIEARKFYDSERAKHVGPVQLPILDGLDIVGPDGRPLDIIDDSGGITADFWPRLNIDLAPYRPEWFEEAMDAVVDDFVRPHDTDGPLAKVIGRAIKEAENGGRRTTMWAVDDDPDIIGWARVEGNENVGSCAFCAMLISRGPVYKEAGDAGLDLENADAVEIWRQAQVTGDNSELDALMNRWHPNCDCKVVPVFDRNNWTGKEQYEELERLWARVTKGYSAAKNTKAGRRTASSDALNAFRRYLERGYRDDDNILRFPQAA